MSEERIGNAPGGAEAVLGAAARYREAVAARNDARSLFEAIGDERIAGNGNEAFMAYVDRSLEVDDARAVLLRAAIA